MYNTPLPTIQKIRKSQINEAALFAINNITEVDQTTLDKFLALVANEVTSEDVSKVRLIGLMNMTMRQNPNAHPDSLLVLIGLLEAQFSPGNQVAGSPVVPSPAQLGLVTQFQIA